ncbi:MAG: ACP S-malonyltransferase [Flavobacteriales bacterium]
MKAFIFPGQGSQVPGMGELLYEKDEKARELLEKGNEVLGYRITDTMFKGDQEALKQTKITQPAIFLHSVALFQSRGFQADMVAGHSLGEISALVANGCLTFEDGLKLVYARAMAMQKACEAQSSTMAAIMGLSDELVEGICTEVEGTVVPANYNSPGQVVISGGKEAVRKACDLLEQKGAKRTIQLPVGGAFHSPLMEPARKELEVTIHATPLHKPSCPVYQNATALPHTSVDEIRENLIAQLTYPVKWTQTVSKMIEDGADSFTEVGPGKVLQGLVKKVEKRMETTGVEA